MSETVGDDGHDAGGTDLRDDQATGLAAERTHLAWRRTALGLTAGGVAAAHVLQTFAGAAAWSIAGIGAIVAAALAITSKRRSTRRDDQGVGGRLVAVCACGLVLLGIGALGFVLLHGA
ncbi:DUF202 domain-containing protein [Cellulomonas sp. McL0617]|uniref:DUF202 domain-containing protein n=1 Tax=Cellulomonas sp. McL0617 TaxID=3415675 RepID=UPI003CF71125